MLERLAKPLPKTQTACYAWVFIPNHTNFLFRTSLAPFATVMRSLLTDYAVSFNRRHKRYGQLLLSSYLLSLICSSLFKSALAFLRLISTSL